ncbi:MAG: response regulator [Nitrospiraceae bacterium]|nr:MAG: response regulator [Nitrospiraceae bacterium]
MKREPVIILAEDDDGHAGLIYKTLKRAGVNNDILHFEDGNKLLNYLFRRGDDFYREEGVSHILLLDLRMPVVDGREVIRQVKQDRELQHIPIIVVSTTDDPAEIENCYSMGCAKYIVKPIQHGEFTEVITQLGHYLLEDVIPGLDAGDA